MAIVPVQTIEKTVADPNAEYESLIYTWTKHRAVCRGEQAVKDFDSVLDLTAFSNLLIPFSNSMDTEQYKFYKAEAEFPGITPQIMKMVVSSLLMKDPTLNIEGLPEEGVNWLLNNFGQDDSSLASFLDNAIWEELQTSRAWVLVNFPQVDVENASLADMQNYYPYPILYKAESVINWRVSTAETGKTKLIQLTIKGYEDDFSENEFHPHPKEVIWVHDLDEQGFYRVRKFASETIADVISDSGVLKQSQLKNKAPVEVSVEYPMKNGEYLTFIPAWSLNGSISCVEPVFGSVINKEIALYNKMSRRNHLLYGAATYTPYLASDMQDEEFDEVVSAGLGSWIHLRAGESAGILDTPTAALADMDRAIAANIEEIAKLGIRILTPENNQSGVALEIRNGSQTATLGNLNLKISNTIKQVIAFMVSWRYNVDISENDVDFSLSTDLSFKQNGVEWLRLVTEWLTQGLIPRSAWLLLVKQNDLLPADYDDAQGAQEILANLENQVRLNTSFANDIQENV
jgi:hypothetical protein